MRKIVSMFVLLLAAGPAMAWGPDGHSIVGEIAQRRLGDNARAQVEALLGPGHSLASEANWADDVRPARPETFNWHFVDIPVRDSYDPAVHCKATPAGDCIIAELERLRTDVRCGERAARAEALRFAVHFVGDLHQPLHTVDEEQGGNGIKIEARILGLACPRCTVRAVPGSLHSLWDSGLVTSTVRNWGAYVARLEGGWLASGEARGAAAGGPREWMEESHAVAREIWPLLPEDRIVTDAYYDKVLPILDRQLGRAGLRLARFLDEALAPRECPAR